MKSKINTAIIGIGGWGKNIARELQSQSNLVGYASRTTSHDIWATENTPSARRMSVEEICSNTSIEAVAIATPIATHADIADQCLEAGKHVFIEKPLALTAVEAEKLYFKAKTKKRILAVGYIFLYHPAYRELIRLTKNNDIRSITLDWKKHGTFEEPITSNLLTHHLALAIDMLGMPQQGHSDCVGAQETECDHLETHLVYETCELTSHIDRMSEHKNHSVEIALADGSAYTWNGASVTHTDTNKKEQVVYETDAQPLAVELQAFLKVVATNDTSALIADGQLGLRVLQLHEMLDPVQ